MPFPFARPDPHPWIDFHRKLPTVAAVSIGIQVGVQITLTRFLADQVPAATLALARYGLALALLAPIALAVGRTRFRPRDLGPIAVLGALNFGLMIAVQNQALQSLTSGRGSLIFATLPFFTMVISVAIGFERLTGAKTLGVLLTVLGVALVIGEKSLTGRPPDGSAANTDWTGETLMLAASLIAAFCSVLYRPFVRRYPALAVSALAMLCADACLLVAGINEGFPRNLATLSAGAWAAVLALGMTSAAFYWLWLWTLGKLPPTRVNVFQALGPITASISAAVFLNEPLSATFALGTATVLAGFIAAFWPERRSTAASRSTQHTE
jgi:drug/metabolite transporter (DMT)-like permease